MAGTPGGDAVELLIDEAWTAYSDGRTAQALKAAERAVRAAERLDDPALLVRALWQEEWALTRLGDYAAAMIRCTRILAMAQDPANHDRLGDRSTARAIGDAYVDFVDAARLRGGVSAAELLNVLDAADQWLVATGHPDWRAGVLYQRAQVHSLIGDARKAVDVAQEALAAYVAGSPGYSLASHRNTLGNFLSQCGRLTEAISHFQAVLDDPGSSTHDRLTALRYLADGTVDKGQGEEALRIADEAVELAQGLDYRAAARALAGRALVHRKLDRFDEALADYGKAIELSPEEDWVIANRGETFRLMRRYEEALADFDRAIELDATYAWAIASRGQVNRALERYDQALTDFDRAIELSPDAAWMHANRGETKRLTKRYDDALTDFDRAIEINLTYAWAIASRAQTHQALQRYDQALTDYDHAIELDPDAAWMYANRGETRRLAKRYREALSDFDRAIQSNPSYWNIASRGQVYQALERYDEALADFDRAIELKSDIAWIYASRADTKRLAKNYFGALSDLGRTIELNPTYTWALEMQAKLRRKLGLH